MRIGFPTKCRYRGGNRAPGAHGKQLWIKKGHLCHGSLRLSHSIPIEVVQRTEITGRAIEGCKVSGVQGRRYSEAVYEVFTDISVHTADGQTALWIVKRRDTEWVRRRLAPMLNEQQISMD